MQTTDEDSFKKFDPLVSCSSGFVFFCCCFILDMFNMILSVIGGQSLNLCLNMSLSS